MSSLLMNSMVKDFAEKGWNIYIITRGEDILPSWGQKIVIRINEPGFNMKKSMVKKNFPLRRFIAGIFNSLYYTYLIFYWTYRSFEEAVKLIEEYNIKYVFAVVPSIEAMLSGAMIKKRYKHMELIMQIEDIMAFNRALYNRTFLYHFLMRFIEKYSNKYVDKYIFFTAEIQKHYRKILDIKKDRVITAKIMNINEKEEERYFPDKIVISHTGSLYNTRHPFFFLEALGNIINDPLYSRYRHKVVINFAGHIPVYMLHKMKEIITLYGLGDMVNILGFISYEEASKLTNKSDINLLITHIRGSEYAIPGKLFEYMGARRPVLALTEDKPVIELIEKHKLGWYISNKESILIEETLIDIFSDFNKIKEYTIDEDDIKEYYAVNIHNKLEEFITCDD